MKKLCQEFATVAMTVGGIFVFNLILKTKLISCENKPIEVKITCKVATYKAIAM